MSIKEWEIEFTAFGIVYSTASWALRTTGHETLTAGLGIVKWFTPTALIPWSGYTMYFCLGYFFRRLAPTISAANRKKWIVAGLALWLFDVVAAYFGVDRADPSTPGSSRPSRCCSFLTRSKSGAHGCRRCSSGRVAGLLRSTCCNTQRSPWLRLSSTTRCLGGGVAALAAPLRLMWWIVMIVGAWALALAVASVVDTTIVRAAQAAFGRVVAAVQGRR